MFRLFFIAVSLLLCHTTQAMPPKEFAKKTGLERSLAYSIKSVKKYYHGRGAVVYGRIVAEKSELNKIATRIDVSCTNGNFICNVFHGRSLCFFLNGYKPICIPVNKKTPFYYYVGDLKFTKLSPQETLSVTGKVIEEKSIASEPITVTLYMGLVPPIFNDHASRGPITKKIASLQIKNGDSYKFEGLSPVKYYVDIKSASSIAKQVYFDNPRIIGEYDMPVPGKNPQKPIKMFNLPTVTLSNAPIIKFSVIVGKVEDAKFNKVPSGNKTPPTFTERVRTFKRACNGKTFIPIMKSAQYHNGEYQFWRNYKLHFEIDKDNHIVPSFGFGNSRYHDFGKISLEEARKLVNTAFMKKSRSPQLYSYRVGNQVMRSEENNFPQNTILENGHLYYFEYPQGNVYFLMKVEFISPETH